MITKARNLDELKQARDQVFSDYVDTHGVDIYIDYNDELSNDQVTQILEGNAEDVRLEIEDNYVSYMDRDDYYWDEMSTELGVPKEQIFEWLDTDGYWPSVGIDDHSWQLLCDHTRPYISAVMNKAEFNFNGWAYGQPIEYSDVKESLKVLGVNPAEFKALKTGGSMTSGEGQFKGYFPNMPNRVPAINVQDLYDNMIVLYDGVLSFCLGSLDDVAEVTQSDSRTITFKAGTNVVMYDWGSGAGITEVKLIRDVTIKRKEVEFRNDKDYRYGIQECYSFDHEYWREGSVEIGK